MSGAVPERAPRPDELEGWGQALQIAALLALDPVALGGVALRSPAGPAREAWLASLRGLVPDVPWLRVPAHVAPARLSGGLDLTATLNAGHPVAERGLLARADGGILLLAMAERVSGATIAQVCAAQDRGEVVAERDGLSLRESARFAVIALDEGVEDDEHVAEALVDRLAFQLDLNGLRAPARLEPLFSASELERARAAFPDVVIGEAEISALASTALALGIGSLRPTLFAIQAARAFAALAGDKEVSAVHARLAARLVLAPRARQVPQPPESPESPESPETPETADAQTAPEPEDPPQPPEQPPPEHDSEPAGRDTRPPESPPDGGDSEEAPRDDPAALEDVILAATQAAIPKGLLAQLKAGAGFPPRSASMGRAGALSVSKLRGRPAGVKAGLPGGGARLNLIETLRAAAPWQRIRRASVSPKARRAGESAPPRRAEVAVRAEDFRVTRFLQRSQTTTIFAIDASGSSALNRLAEAKGAVELLLADCYVRRDRVAVLSFRGRAAELLLPPTRSLVRAKRCLSRLPGGGGTPLAAGIDAAFALAEGLRRRGETPTVVLLTDGRANVARDGTPGRDQAGRDALNAARRLRAAGLAALWLDTSPRAGPQAQALAREMGARYLILPYANSQLLSAAVRAALA
jgi:magnesium chelatase subunit D